MGTDSTRATSRETAGPGNTVTTGDGTEIFYKDWGTGQPVVFSHGWPLNADAWDDQMRFVAANGFRAIAHDRRGHGRSSQPWDGNDMDTYADDLAALIEALDLHDVVLVGHSTGGGEVTRYIGRHGTGARRQGRAGRRRPAADAEDRRQPRAACRSRRSTRSAPASPPTARSSTRTSARTFYGANRPGSKVSQGVRDAFWLHGACRSASRARTTASRPSRRRTSPTTSKKFDVPTLIIHGDDDQIVPIGASAMVSSKLVKGATLKVYPGAPHGLFHTHRERSTPT